MDFKRKKTSGDIPSSNANKVMQERGNRSKLKRKATEHNNKNIEGDGRRKKAKYAKRYPDTNYDVVNDTLGKLDIHFKSKETDDHEIIKKKKERLYNLEIKITHKIPPQHEIGNTAGSRPLSEIEKKYFLRHGPLKSGPFTPAEDEVIRNNWATFCKTHYWNPKDVQPFLSMTGVKKFRIRKVETRRKFIQFLANGLPWRSLYSIYYRFKYLYGNHNRCFRRYTSDEDKKIMSYITNKKSPKKFSQLGKELHRSGHAVWVRYKRLKEKEQASRKLQANKVKWTLPLIGKFIKAFLGVTLSETVEELKDAIIPKPVWQKLEEKLGIDYNVLKLFWIDRLHMQLFCPEPIYLSDIKIKLIEYVYAKGLSSTREIVWRRVAKYFDGIPTVFLCRVFLFLVRTCAKRLRTKDFLAIIEYLYTYKIKEIRDAATDKMLPRLSYDQGVVKVINDNIPEETET